MANDLWGEIAGAPGKILQSVENMFAPTKKTFYNPSYQDSSSPNVFHSLGITSHGVDASAPSPQSSQNPKITDLTDINSYGDFIKDSIKKNNSHVDEAYVKSLVDLESSVGKNRTNEKSDYGKYGWLVGLTPIAAKELTRLNVPFDTDTPEGAVDAAIKYSTIKGKGIDDMAKLYDEVYKTKSGYDSKDLFTSRYNNYKSS